MLGASTATHYLLARSIAIFAVAAAVDVGAADLRIVARAHIATSGPNTLSHHPNKRCRMQAQGRSSRCRLISFGTVSTPQRLRRKSPSAGPHPRRSRGTCRAT